MKLPNLIYPKTKDEPNWMTTEIKDLMEQRMLVKNSKVQYNRVDKEINKKCKEAKEGWLEEDAKTQSQP